MILQIGLTGGIGSGKSVVAGIFKVLGIPVFDADTEAKLIMETNAGLREAVTDKFGSATYSQGKLDRKYLAAIVFNDPVQLACLNALVHPFAIAAALDWAKRQTSPYVVKEAALFFESGSASDISYIIGVSAPEHIRVNRVMHRDGITRQQVTARMDRQLQEEIKMRLCDFVIINDDRHLLIPQVLSLHERFIAMAKHD